MNQGPNQGMKVKLYNQRYFVSPFPSKGYKIPKFECKDLTLSENLKMQYFLSSLTKCAFTWFTNLPPNSIHD